MILPEMQRGGTALQMGWVRKGDRVSVRFREHQGREGL